MNYLSLVLKNKQFNQIVQDFNNNKASHAYLLVSADNLFVENIAYMLASNLTNSNINRVINNIHPDIFVYGKNGKIDVGQVNDIISNISVAPYEADYKVYCLLNIESMNEQSQNKILKSLEEPPKNVIFILTCCNTKNILNTVLSRVKLLQIDTIDNQGILELISQKGISNDVAQVAVSCANGNSTLASKLTTNSFVQMYNNILDMFNNIKSSRDCLKYVSLFDNKNVDKNEFIDVCILLLRDVSMILSKADNLVVNKHHFNYLTQIAQQFSLGALTNIISECVNAKEDLYFNTNSTAVLDKLILVIAQEKVKCKK